MSKTTKIDRVSLTEDSEAPRQAVAPRIYSGQMEVDHDLYKLKAAEMKKNVSFTDRPRYEEILHQHIFHSVDSAGVVQTETNKVGGHFHIVELDKSVDGAPVVKSCSPAMMQVRMRVDGELKNVAVPVKDDTHTHEVEYLGSQRIKTRQISMEYAKFQAQIDAKVPRGVPGVESR